ncbi:hypothetical protein EAH87_09100 [Sphingomonas koreensis]|nr:hypothetical protein EAH87_09100 [Sphingomonas koreensis]
MAELARTKSPLCLVRLTYRQPADALDRLMPEHAAWLERCIADDLLLVGGRQAPRTGGVLIFRGHKAEVEALANSDPFVTNGAATIEVIEFVASFAADGFAALLQ